MSTNKKVSISTELEKLESERLISESLIATARDRYASEIGSPGEIEKMIKCVGVKPKTYPLPNHLKKRMWMNLLVEKIKKLLGI